MGNRREQRSCCEPDDIIAHGFRDKQLVFFGMFCIYILEDW